MKKQLQADRDRHGQDQADQPPEIAPEKTRDQNRGSIEVDLTQYLDSGNIRGIPVVRPGDIVYVPRRENFIRELSGLLTDAFVLFGIFQLVK